MQLRNGLARRLSNLNVQRLSVKSVKPKQLSDKLNGTLKMLPKWRPNKQGKVERLSNYSKQSPRSKYPSFYEAIRMETSKEAGGTPRLMSNH